MNILFLGDVTGRSGREAVLKRLPSLKQEVQADFTIVNGENSAHGKGITSRICHSLTAAGADVITLGNHAFSKNEILLHMEECPDLIRPANLEPLDRGSAITVRTVKGKRLAVVNLLGSVFMDCATESPITVMDRILKNLSADIIFVDLHAEATSEKELFFYVFHDRLTAVIGTHTHVQTADEQILDGCAYLSDAGMCGSYHSILGRDVNEVIARSVHREATRYTPSEEPAMICGVLITIDESTNRAIAIRRIQERP